MDSLSKKIQNLGIHDIRNAARFAQNMIVQYEPYQVDIRRATNTDAWGPTPKHLEKVLRNRFQVPLYLMTEYTLKRLVDHIATRPKNLYEKARKDYVNYGSEWRVVLKCLVVVEYLLLNVSDGDELNQVRSCLTTHRHILTREVLEYRVSISNDGKMEVHERGIKKKCENILQLMDDTPYLKKERSKNTKNHMKIRQQGESSLYNANPLDDGGSASVNDTEFIDDDDLVDDETADDYEVAAHHTRTTAEDQRSHRKERLDEQRRQRREILRERIKTTEQQRQKQQQQQKEQEQQQAVPDLIDFDFNAETANTKDNADEEEEDDDDFGDFQSGSRASKPNNNTKIKSTNNTNNNNNDLLDWDGAANGTTKISEPKKKDDAFADLFSYSKSLI